MSRRFPYGPVHRCPQCGDPVDPLQAGEPDGGCHREACRREARARWQALEDDADRRRRREGAARLRAGGRDPDGGPWTVVPANDAGPVPLEPSARAGFRAHLRRVLAELEATGPSPREPGTRGAAEAPSTEEAAAIARACATCRGWCCRRGGTHAFLDARSLERVLLADPTRTADEVEATYLAHLGETHLEGGCVFQGEAGCTLPRTLRSDTCNTWLCADLRAQRARWTAGVDVPRATRFVAIPAGKPLKNS